eukprot:Pgem_evm1s5598
MKTIPVSNNNNNEVSFIFNIDDNDMITVLKLPTLSQKSKPQTLSRSYKRKLM